MQVVIYLICVIVAVSCEPHNPNLNTYSEELSDNDEMDATDAVLFNYVDTFYVPVYSDIYNQTKNIRFLLTATLSIRNTSHTDTLIIRDIEYFNTKGEFVRHYIDHPIYLVPMATVEYVIEQKDRTGGSGANFIVVLTSKDHRVKPIVQSVMVSVSGQQGLAFTCEGQSIKKESIPLE